MINYEGVHGRALTDLRTRNLEPIEAISTPWESWNLACRGRGGQVGLALGWHILVAGKSGGGKTFVACNIAVHGVEIGEAVTFHSLEMDWDELAARHLAIVGGEAAWRLNPGKSFSPITYDAAAEKINHALGSLTINTDPMGKLSQVVEGITRAYEQRGSRLHIIDYLQLAWTGDATSRYDRITEVSHAVRELAKKHKLVTVALSQMNRDGIKTPGKPQKESMDGGGALEQDADQVLLMDHSRKQPAVNAEGRNRGWVGWMILDKNRHGEEPEIPIRFDSDTFRIRELLPDEVPDAEPKSMRALR